MGEDQLAELLTPLTEPLLESVGDDIIQELLKDILLEDAVVVSYTGDLIADVLGDCISETIVEYRKEQTANDTLFGDVRSSKSARVRVEKGAQTLLDYLYMFCLISLADLEEFRRAFDAADQNGTGSLDTVQTTRAISLVCGASAVEFEGSDVAGYLGVLVDSPVSRVPFHLFTIIAAMSKKVTRVLNTGNTLPAGTVLGVDGTRTLPDGTKLLLDGTVVLLTGVQLLPTGDTILKNGTVLRPDGTKILPDGRKVLQDGRVFLPNGAAADPLDDDEIEAARNGSAIGASRSAAPAAHVLSAGGNAAGAGAFDNGTRRRDPVTGGASVVDRDPPTRKGPGVEFTGKSLLKTKESKFRLGQ